MNARRPHLNLLVQKNDAHLSLKLPRKMRDLIRQQAQKYNMTDSNYVKMILEERLEKEYISND